LDEELKIIGAVGNCLECEKVKMKFFEVNQCTWTASGQI